MKIYQKGKQIYNRFNSALRTNGNQLYSMFNKEIHRKSEGYTLVEITIVILLMAILMSAGLSAFGGYLSKAREAKVQADFSVFKSAATNFLYEQPDTLNNLQPDSILALNEYLDSKNPIEGSIVKHKDPWGEYYQISFNRSLVLNTGTTITLKSAGGGKTYMLLVHYKDGEVRTGTAGFPVDEGTELSDATKIPVVSITDMWAKLP